MTIFSRATVLVAGLVFSLLAFALTLDVAKQQGLVGEQPSGYLGVVGKSTPELEALVRDINQKRRAAYENIASRNGTDISAVEQLAGKKAIEQTPSGYYVKMPAGDWVKVQ
jgi:uncharacterized protein